MSTRRGFPYYRSRAHSRANNLPINTFVTPPYYHPFKVIPPRKSIRALFEPLNRISLTESKTGLGTYTNPNFNTRTWRKQRRKLGKARTSMNINARAKSSFITVKSVNMEDDRESRPYLNSVSCEKFFAELSDEKNAGTRLPGKCMNTTINPTVLSVLHDMRQEAALKEQRIKQLYDAKEKHLLSQIRSPLLKPVGSGKGSNAGLRNTPSTTSTRSHKSSKRKKRKTSHTIIPDSREQEFRYIYERLKVHFLLQEEALRNMSTPDKLPRMIHALVRFEKELLEYMTGPKPHPDAKALYKELRNRRAELMTKLSAYPEARTKFISGKNYVHLDSPLRAHPTPKVQSRASVKSDGGESTASTQRKHSKSKEPAESKTTKNSRKILNQYLKNSGLNPKTAGGEYFNRLSDHEDESEKSNLLRTLQQMTRPARIRTAENRMPDHCQTSPRPSTTQVGPAKSGTKDTAISARPSIKIKWKKSDFTRLLPHPGEIPKNSSRVGTDLPKKDTKIHDTTTYMSWLEEIMAQKMGEKIEDREEVNAARASTAGMGREKSSKKQLPRWAQIITKKDKDPAEEFKKHFNLQSMPFEPAAHVRKALLLDSGVEVDASTFKPFTPINLMDNLKIQAQDAALRKKMENVSNTIRSLVAGAGPGSANPGKEAPHHVVTLGAQQSKEVATAERERLERRNSMAYNNTHHLGLRLPKLNHQQQPQQCPPDNFKPPARKIPRLAFMNNSTFNTILQPNSVDQADQQSNDTVNSRGATTAPTHQPWDMAETSVMSHSRNPAQESESKTQGIYATNTNARSWGSRNNHQTLLQFLKLNARREMSKHRKQIASLRYPRRSKDRLVLEHALAIHASANKERITNLSGENSSRAMNVITDQNSQGNRAPTHVASDINHRRL